MLTHWKLLVVAFGFACAGCAAYSPKEVASPSKLTVSAAMLDIGSGFANLKKGITQDDPYNKTGLYPCKVLVTLNVTASAEQGGGLVLDTGIKPPSAYIEGGLKVDQKNGSSAQRDNNITIEMYNPSCIPNNTVAYNTPDKVEMVARAMEAGVHGAPR